MRWLIGRLSPRAFSIQWADPSFSRAADGTLAQRLPAALKAYPGDLLVVHRDAERETWAVRAGQIRAALEQLREKPPAVCVVPVRMTEAWLLFDEPALRRAAGNPNGRDALDLPDIRQVENLADPKNILERALSRASGLRGRRLASFRAGPAVYRLADLIEDYGPLRGLPAFRALEGELEQVIAEQGWHQLG